MVFSWSQFCLFFADVVPSDIIVGLLLLRKLQRLEQVSIINEVNYI